MRTRDDFLSDMAARFAERAEIPIAEAKTYAAQVLGGYDDAEIAEFEADGWDAVGAREVADTDMSYWEG